MQIVTRIARRCLALALLLISGAAAYGTIIGPYFEHIARLQEELVQKRLLLGRLAAVAAQETDLAELEPRATAAVQSRAFASGTSDAIITANLQSRLARLATEVGARVRTTRALPQRNSGTLRLIGVQIQLIADTDQIQRILHGIETSQTLLFIEGLTLTTTTAHRKSNEESDLMEARIDVVAAVAPKRS